MSGCHPVGDEGRYAIYFTPDAASPLARFGAEWLGYDVAAGAAIAQPTVPGIAAEQLHAMTAEPRRYGFHATLKPPFFLADGGDAASLDTAVAALAGGFPAFAAPPLRLARISGFWALTLSEPCPMTDRLAELCVKDLDRFRAPPVAAELARRRGAGLSLRQETLLARWGYPYVLDEFRFHLTLTARLDGDKDNVVGRELAPFVAPFCQTSLMVDAVSLFHQERNDGPFRLVRRYELAG
jgi:putative phosphonate metabolism protein